MTTVSTTSLTGLLDGFSDTHSRLGGQPGYPSFNPWQEWRIIR
jgi:hypothetical protein